MADMRAAAATAALEHLTSFGVPTSVGDYVATRIADRITTKNSHLWTRDLVEYAGERTAMACDIRATAVIAAVASVDVIAEAVRAAALAVITETKEN